MGTNEKKDMQERSNNPKNAMVQSNFNRLTKENIIRKIQAMSFIVFVDNLPSSMTKSWLWHIFQFEGKVVDVFLSRKSITTSSLPFAFVCFSNKQDVVNAMESLNRGCEIEAKEEKYKRVIGEKKEDEKE